MATARQIITRALRLIQVLGADEPGDAAEVVDALDTLNALLEAWPLSPLMVLAGQTSAYPLNSSATYTVGPGGDFDMPRVASLVSGSFIRFQGIDRPLVPIDQESYAAIVNKDVAGIPGYIYYEPGAGNGTLTLYPSPRTGMELHLASLLPFTAFADLDADYPLPPGYERALQYSLAIEVAPEYGKEAGPSVQRIAQTSIRQIKRANTGVGLLSMPGGIPLSGGIWAGAYISGFGQ